MRIKNVQLLLESLVSSLGEPFSESAEFDKSDDAGPIVKSIDTIHKILNSESPKIASATLSSFINEINDILPNGSRSDNAKRTEDAELFSDVNANYIFL